MSTVTEIKEAIEKLSPAHKELLLMQLFPDAPYPDDNDPEVLAAIDRGIADDDADRVSSLEEIDAKVAKWILKLPSPEVQSRS